MKNLLTVCLLVLAAPVYAQVTCTKHVMTGDYLCRSNIERSGQHFYFFSTNDAGTVANVVFSFAGLISAARPNGVMVKLDDNAPFKASASPLRPNVNCRGSGGCRWWVGASAQFTRAQFSEIAAASRMLVSFSEGAHVSDPIEVDPKKISSWFQEWTEIRAGASQDRPVSNPSPGS